MGNMRINLAFRRKIYEDDLLLPDESRDIKIVFLAGQHVIQHRASEEGAESVTSAVEHRDPFTHASIQQFGPVHLELWRYLAKELLVWLCTRPQEELRNCRWITKSAHGIETVVHPTPKPQHQRHVRRTPAAKHHVAGSTGAVVQVVLIEKMQRVEWHDKVRHGGLDVNQPLANGVGTPSWMGNEVEQRLGKSS